MNKPGGEANAVDRLQAKVASKVSVQPPDKLQAQTPRQRFIAALERRPLVGRVPTFELDFFLTMEALGKVLPQHRRFEQWDQMEEKERQLKLKEKGVCVLLSNSGAGFVREIYKDFVVNWLTRVRPAYGSFKYKSGQSDLPIQMYHVLRCGIVHTLSLIPDTRGQSHGGRDRSIVLAHRTGAGAAGLKHLDAYSSTNTPDAALFVAEDLVDDIEAVVSLIFSQAVPGSPLEARMHSWLAAHPLISAGA